MGRPIFRGKGELSQLNAIFGVLGCPRQRDWPELDEMPLIKAIRLPYELNENRLGQKLCRSLDSIGLGLVSNLLSYNPSARLGICC